MDLKLAARIVVVLALGAGLTAAISVLRSGRNGSEDASAIRLRDPGGETADIPSRSSELARCRAIGQAALEDAACRRAWAESRRRFFQAIQP
ncbi:putative entry exclusion protein TrbK-alt [Pseudochelatococcus sp. B33]